jgi:hypothetical protein
MPDAGPPHDQTPPPEPAPAPPMIAPPPPSPLRFQGCIGFFLGTLAGVLALMVFVGVAMSGRNMEGRPFAILFAGVILGLAIWGAGRLRRRNPGWTRLYQGVLIGLALMGIVLGLCVAISFT